MRHTPGVVSIWTGTVRDEAELFDHVTMEYDDGEATSPFLTETGIDWYDEDFAEGSVSADPARALSEHSHSAGFASLAGPDLASRPETNALYLIYDLDASAQHDRPGLLKFLGTYPV